MSHLPDERRRITVCRPDSALAVPTIGSTNNDNILFQGNELFELLMWTLWPASATMNPFWRFNRRSQKCSVICSSLEVVSLLLPAEFVTEISDQVWQFAAN